MAGNRPKQHEIFNIERKFSQSKFGPSRFKEARACGCQRGVPL